MAIQKFILKTFASFFYVGYLPFIPGTFGSMAGVFLFYLIRDNALTHFLLTLTLVSVGFLVCGRTEKIFNKKDARWIVIDEVAGMLISLLCLPYYGIEVVISAFILFRILDAFKPYPTDRVQSLGGSIGIMGDDIVAALYTNIVLQLALRLVSFNIS